MNRENNSGRKPVSNRIWIVAGVLSIALIFTAVTFMGSRAKAPEMVTLSDLAAGINDGQVVKIEDTMLSGELNIHYADGKIEKGMRDPSAPLVNQLILLGVKEEALSKIELSIGRSTPATGVNPAGLLMILGVVGAAFFVTMRSGKTERWGKKNFEETEVPPLRFKDVAGLDDNLQELRDIVTFLKEGDKFAAIGAKMPRGVLMVGDPGCGKTLMAKAVAGEAGVPFFATSGSEFTEVFVGVGASRIRSLFHKARKKAPCIVFIDEIDAVGRARHRSESGAEMEQDQTLNQLLVEMDGFKGSEGVVVLAATNRVDVLDAALTRPGRFDRRVFINRPDVKGREEILQIHVKGKKLAENVVLANLARATPGLVGADLANIVNEAAISAVRNGHEEIQMQDLEEAVEKHIAGGVARKNQVMSPDEKEIVAYHEAGHAVVMHATKGCDPVYKITIIPRGQAGGYTMALPEQDNLLISRVKLLARITGLLGGRAAEEIFFHDITSGASNDLKVATQLAEEMVLRLGMDPRTGLRVFEQPGYSLFTAPQGSQKTFEAIDDTLKDILDSCYSEARRIILEKRDQLQAIASELLEVETLDRERFVDLMES
jgi:cell division protease FtsH